MKPPEQIKYYDDKSILLINNTGKLRRIYTPFTVQCIYPVGKLNPNTMVYVEQVAPHHEYRILYRVFSDWMPYSCFRIIIHY